MINKVLVISDSLALARDIPELTLFEETWPELLKKEGLQIDQISIGGATSTDLLKQAYYHKLFNPDIVFVQVGIVDCAPRFATRFEVDFLTRLPVIGKKILKKMNTPKVRNRRQISYVNEKQFSQNLLDIKRSFNCPTFFLTILPASKDYEILVPGVIDKINRYNKVIKSYDFIDLEEIPQNHIMSDHHHLNKLGHEFIFNKMLPLIK
ncbi:SGNH/GDSL hydrolase family protein [Chryseobacterium sp.]|uniref:SGNH/GDSL hydrolase family protein n=1 Tax=Chryseobacterium sp. TaxID=1871047 RepID=UPI0025BDC33B|nr:SGNH/GDSL hydrolase family protein [Chryseobacterium sp.]